MISDGTGRQAPITTLDSAGCSIYNLLRKCEDSRPELPERFTRECIALRVHLVNQVATSIEESSERLL